MPGAVIAIDQDRPSGSSFGTPGVARKDLWLSRMVRPRCTTSGNTSYQWTLLSVPPASGVEIEAGTEDQIACAFNPTAKGSYRLQLVTNGGGPGNIQILIVAITRDAAGAVLGRGWRVPAAGEQGNENNFDGQTDGWDPSVREIIEDMEENGFGDAPAPGGGGGADNGVAARAANVPTSRDKLTRSTELNTGVDPVLGVGLVRSFGDTSTAPLLYFASDADTAVLRKINTVTKVASTVAAISDLGPLFVQGKMVLMVGETECYITPAPGSTVYTVTVPGGNVGFDGFAIARYVAVLDQTFWFITSVEDNCVYRVPLNPGGNVEAEVAFAGGDPETITGSGIALDDEGNVWVVWADSASVQKYTVNDDGDLVVSGAPIAAHITSNLLFDGKYLFGCNSTDEQIVRIKAADGTVTLFDFPGITNRSSLAFDGKLVWVTYGTRTTSFHPETLGVFQSLQASNNGLGQIVADVSTGNLFVAVRSSTVSESVVFYTPGHHEVLDTLRLRNVTPGHVLQADGATGQITGIDPSGLGGGGGGSGLLTFTPADVPLNETASMLGGNFGIGCGFVITTGPAVKITGVRFWWGGGAATVRTSIWRDNGSGTGPRLATIDRAVSGIGFYTSVFASPYVVPTNLLNRWMCAFIWDTSGAQYPKVSSFAQPGFLPAVPFLGGSRIIWLHFARYAEADGPPTSGEGGLYPVEPILELV